MVVGVVLGAGVEANGLCLRGRLRVEKAVRLWNKKAVNSFLVCGGITNPAIPVSEASAIKQLLMTHGIPAKKIRLEDKSMNTLENALFAKKLFWGSEMILITDHWHALRAFKTFRHIFPKRVKISCA